MPSSEPGGVGSIPTPATWNVRRRSVDEFGLTFRQEGLMVQEEDAGPANRRFGCDSRWVQSVFDLHNRLWMIRVRETFVPFKCSPTACCAGRFTGCVGKDFWPSGGTEDTRRSERRAFGHGSSNLPLVSFGLFHNPLMRESSANIPRVRTGTTGL